MMIENIDPNYDVLWLQQKLDIADAIRSSKIRSKYTAIDMDFYDLQAKLHQKDDYFSKILRRLNKNNGKLRDNINFLEKDLDNISEGMRHEILSVKVNEAKTIYSLNEEIDKGEKVILNLTKQVNDQRSFYNNEKQNAINEKKEYMRKLDEEISDLREQIYDTEVKLFSRARDGRNIHEMKSSTKDLRYEIEDSMESVSFIDQLIDQENQRFHKYQESLNEKENQIENMIEQLKQLRKENQKLQKRTNESLD